jgi:hypothetical protein
MNQPYPVRVGELRPSQLLWAYGSGSLVDLPQVSVVVMGLNYWDPTACVPIGEDRLLTAVRRVAGPQVARLGPPIRPGVDGPFNPFTPEARIGVPVSPFPGWLRCPLCGRMAEVGGGLFELKSHAFRPDRTLFVHSNCDRARVLLQQRCQPVSSWPVVVDTSTTSHGTSSYTGVKRSVRARCDSSSREHHSKPKTCGCAANGAREPVDGRCFR